MRILFSDFSERVAEKVAQLEDAERNLNVKVVAIDERQATLNIKESALKLREAANNYIGKELTEKAFGLEDREQILTVKDAEIDEREAAVKRKEMALEEREAVIIAKETFVVRAKSRPKTVGDRLSQDIGWSRKMSSTPVNLQPAVSIPVQLQLFPEEHQAVGDYWKSMKSKVRVRKPSISSRVVMILKIEADIDSNQHKSTEVFL